MKNPHGEFGEVKLADKEYAKLIVRFGKEDAEDRITGLDLYLASISRKYKSHYATILNWDRMDKKKKQKTILYPVKGKWCEKCGLPGVWKSKGDYDNWYCLEHSPKAVRDKYS